MITNINYLGEDGIIIEYDIYNIHKKICFSDIEPYWNYATEEDFEGGRAYISRNYIIFTMLVANSQGGGVIAWDTELDKVVHISDGSYCEALSVFDNKIYCLYVVSNYNIP